jgi:tRNA nucleotidyltransferase (CCA-adding enzyme)
MFGKLNHKAFKVGGCVRDEILGFPVTDFDYVLEADTDEFLLTFPDAETVGKDFPVYLIQGNEVSLTRTEKSTGTGYGDFELTGVGVSLVDDLGRRDFTINAVAQHVLTNEIVDPFCGVQHMRTRTLQMINPIAFEEDPVRILRGARFVARFNMGIESKTADAMSKNAFRLEFVTKERIALEFKKVYEQAEKPSIFFETLAMLDALKVIFPDLDALRFVTAGPNEFHGGKTAFEHTMDAINRAKENKYGFKVFMAALVHDLGKGTTKPEILPHHYGHENGSARLAEKFFSENRFDANVSRFCTLFAKLHMRAHLMEKMKPIKRVRFVKSIRKDEREDFLNAHNTDHPMDAVREDSFRKVFAALNTKVEVPDGTKDPKTFVERFFVRVLREIEQND